MQPVLLKNYNSAAIAEIEKNLLEAEGIRSIIRRGELHPYQGDAAGASLWVNPSDLARAQDIVS